MGPSGIAAIIVGIGSVFSLSVFLLVVGISRKLMKNKKAISHSTDGQNTSKNEPQNTLSRAPQNDPSQLSSNGPSIPIKPPNTPDNKKHKPDPESSAMSTASIQDNNSPSTIPKNVPPLPALPGESSPRNTSTIPKNVPPLPALPGESSPRNTSTIPKNVPPLPALPGESSPQKIPKSNPTSKNKPTNNNKPLPSTSNAGRPFSSQDLQAKRSTLRPTAKSSLYYSNSKELNTDRDDSSTPPNPIDSTQYNDIIFGITASQINGSNLPTGDIPKHHKKQDNIWWSGEVNDDDIMTEEDIVPAKKNVQIISLKAKGTILHSINTIINHKFLTSVMPPEKTSANNNNGVSDHEWDDDDNNTSARDLGSADDSAKAIAVNTPTEPQPSVPECKNYLLRFLGCHKKNNDSVTLQTINERSMMQVWKDNFPKFSTKDLLYVCSKTPDFFDECTYSPDEDNLLHLILKAVETHHDKIMLCQTDEDYNKLVDEIFNNSLLNQQLIDRLPAITKAALSHEISINENHLLYHRISIQHLAKYSDILPVCESTQNSQSYINQDNFWNDIFTHGHTNLPNTIHNIPNFLPVMLHDVSESLQALMPYACTGAGLYNVSKTLNILYNMALSKHCTNHLIHTSYARPLMMIGKIFCKFVRGISNNMPLPDPDFCMPEQWNNLTQNYNTSALALALKQSPKQCSQTVFSHILSDSDQNSTSSLQQIIQDNVCPQTSAAAMILEIDRKKIIKNSSNIPKSESSAVDETHKAYFKYLKIASVFVNLTESAHAIQHLLAVSETQEQSQYFYDLFVNIYTSLESLIINLKKDMALYANAPEDTAQSYSHTMGNRIRIKCHDWLYENIYILKKDMHNKNRAILLSKGITLPDPEKLTATWTQYKKACVLDQNAHLRYANDLQFEYADTVRKPTASSDTNIDDPHAPNNDPPNNDPPDNDPSDNDPPNNDPPDNDPSDNDPPDNDPSSNDPSVNSILPYENDNSTNTPLLRSNVYDDVYYSTCPNNLYPTEHTYDSVPQDQYLDDDHLYDLVALDSTDGDTADKTGNHKITSFTGNRSPDQSSNVPPKIPPLPSTTTTQGTSLNNAHDKPDNRNRSPDQSSNVLPKIPPLPSTTTTQGTSVNNAHDKPDNRNRSPDQSSNVLPKIPPLPSTTTTQGTSVNNTAKLKQPSTYHSHSSNNNNVTDRKSSSDDTDALLHTKLQSTNNVVLKNLPERVVNISKIKSNKHKAINATAKSRAQILTKNALSNTTELLKHMDRETKINKDQSSSLPPPDQDHALLPNDMFSAKMLYNGSDVLCMRSCFSSNKGACTQDITSWYAKLTKRRSSHAPACVKELRKNFPHTVSHMLSVAMTFMGGIFNFQDTNLWTAGTFDTLAYSPSASEMSQKPAEHMFGLELHKRNWKNAYPVLNVASLSCMAHFLSMDITNILPFTTANNRTLQGHKSPSQLRSNDRFSSLTSLVVYNEDNTAIDMMQVIHITTCLCVSIRCAAVDDVVARKMLPSDEGPFEKFSNFRSLLSRPASYWKNGKGGFLTPLLRVFALYKEQYCHSKGTSSMPAAQEDLCIEFLKKMLYLAMRLPLIDYPYNHNLKKLQFMFDSDSSAPFFDRARSGWYTPIANNSRMETLKSQLLPSVPLKERAAISLAHDSMHTMPLDSNAQSLFHKNFMPYLDSSKVYKYPHALDFVTNLCRDTLTPEYESTTNSHFMPVSWLSSFTHIAYNYTLYQKTGNNLYFLSTIMISALLSNLSSHDIFINTEDDNIPYDTMLLHDMHEMHLHVSYPDNNETCYSSAFLNTISCSIFYDIPLYSLFPCKAELLKQCSSPKDSVIENLSQHAEKCLSKNNITASSLDGSCYMERYSIHNLEHLSAHIFIIAVSLRLELIHIPNTSLEHRIVSLPMNGLKDILRAHKTTPITMGQYGFLTPLISYIVNLQNKYNAQIPTELLEKLDKMLLKLNTLAVGEQIVCNPPASKYNTGKKSPEVSQVWKNIDYDIDTAYADHASLYASKYPSHQLSDVDIPNKTPLTRTPSALSLLLGIKDEYLMCYNTHHNYHDTTLPFSRFDFSGPKAMYPNIVYSNNQKIQPLLDSKFGTLAPYLIDSQLLNHTKFNAFNPFSCLSKHNIPGYVPHNLTIQEDLIYISKFMNAPCTADHKAYIVSLQKASAYNTTNDFMIFHCTKTLDLVPFHGALNDPEKRLPKEKINCYNSQYLGANSIAQLSKSLFDIAIHMRHGLLKPELTSLLLSPNDKPLILSIWNTLFNHKTCCLRDDITDQEIVLGKFGMMTPLIKALVDQQRKGVTFSAEHCAQILHVILNITYVAAGIRVDSKYIQYNSSMFNLFSDTEQINGKMHTLQNNPMLYNSLLSRYSVLKQFKRIDENALSKIHDNMSLTSSDVKEFMKNASRGDKTLDVTDTQVAHTISYIIDGNDKIPADDKTHNTLTVSGINVSITVLDNEYNVLLVPNKAQKQTAYNKKTTVMENLSTQSCNTKSLYNKPVQQPNAQSSVERKKQLLLSSNILCTNGTNYLPNQAWKFSRLPSTNTPTQNCLINAYKRLQINCPYSFIKKSEPDIRRATKPLYTLSFVKTVILDGQKGNFNHFLQSVFSSKTPVIIHDDTSPCEIIETHLTTVADSIQAIVLNTIIANYNNANYWESQHNTTDKQNLEHFISNISVLENIFGSYISLPKAHSPKEFISYYKKHLLDITDIIIGRINIQDGHTWLYSIKKWIDGGMIVDSNTGCGINIDNALPNYRLLPREVQILQLLHKGDLLHNNSYVDLLHRMMLLSTNPPQALMTDCDNLNIEIETQLLPNITTDTSIHPTKQLETISDSENKDPKLIDICGSYVDPILNNSSMLIYTVLECLAQLSSLELGLFSEKELSQRDTAMDEELMSNVNILQQFVDLSLPQDRSLQNSYTNTSLPSSSAEIHY